MEKNMATECRNGQTAHNIKVNGRKAKRGEKEN